MNACWSEARLGDYLHVKHGFAFQGEFFSDSGSYVVLTPGNFYEEGGFKPKSGTEKFYTAEPSPEFVLHKGDLVIVMTEQAQGLLGSSAMIPEDGIYLHNQRIGLIEIAPGLDARFTFYLFNTREVRDQIQATATGSKVRHTAPSRVEAVRVVLPPFSTQRKIAAILSAYDDLIENNTRRIGILEEMAQRIYRDWFVDFRYPGYEGVPLVDSELGPIPRGWGTGLLGDLVEEVRDRTTPGTTTEGRPYVPIDAISPRCLALWEWRPGGEAASSLLTFHRSDFLFGAMRPYFHKVAIAPWEGTTRSTCFVLRTRSDDTWALAALSLFEDQTIAFATANASGTTIPYARWRGGLANMPIVMPPAALAEQFQAVSEPMLRALQDSGSMLANLRATRDLLLPRLMSGEIDVGELDIPTSEAAA
jgi:type I restriction enzyme S subunit